MAASGNPLVDDDCPCAGAACRRSGTVVTSPQAPVRGELAAALACGANMAVPAGRAWNLLIDPHTTVASAQERLREWGIDAPDAFHATLRRLLDEGTDRDVEHVLSLRHWAWHNEWRALDFTAWRDMIVQTSRSSGAARTTTNQYVETARRILAYERAFRADGLLPPLGVVNSMRAYDWGRAINVVHWALTAGLCDNETATELVLQAGRLCATHYSSWTDP